MKILIADDDPAIRALLAAICRHGGYSCEVAADGAEALSLLDRAEFDAILLDLMMPRVNGFQVIEALRLREKRPRIIVITAQGATQIAALDRSVVASVLHKPFDLPSLQAVLR